MKTTYRIYLRLSEQQAPSESTTTDDVDAALAAFAALVGRIDLDGHKTAAILNTTTVGRLAYHRFDVPLGHPDNWRNKLNQIEWPDERPKC